MSLGSYRINIDALVARIIYRWRGRSIVGSLLLLAAVGLWVGVIPPFWKGRADLTIVAPRAATITVDGQPWPHPIYTGRHSVQTTLPDGRGAWADIQLLANQALTLTLPLGLMEPRERALPPAAPGTHIDQVIEDLTRQVLPLEAACQSLLQSVQADPGGTRFWNLRVEQAMKEKRITRSVARALLDALEGCQTDRTVWIDSGIVDDPQKTAYAKGASPRDAGIRRELLKDFFISLNVYNTYDSDPPNPEADTNDVGVVWSIGWSY